MQCALLVYDLGWFLLRHNQYVQIEIARIVFVHVYISKYKTQRMRKRKKNEYKSIRDTMSTILLSVYVVCANRENWQKYRYVIIIESVLRALSLSLTLFSHMPKNPFCLLAKL